MFTLIRSLGFRTALRQEATPLTISLMIAQLFFRFHSFILECGAFLATWFVLSWATSFVMERWMRHPEREGERASETVPQKS